MFAINFNTLWITPNTRPNRSIYGPGEAYLHSYTCSCHMVRVRFRRNCCIHFDLDIVLCLFIWIPKFHFVTNLIVFIGVEHLYPGNYYKGSTPSYRIVITGRTLILRYSLPDLVDDTCRKSKGYSVINLIPQYPWIMDHTTKAPCLNEEIYPHIKHGYSHQGEGHYHFDHCWFW